VAGRQRAHWGVVLSILRNSFPRRRQPHLPPPPPQKKSPFYYYFFFFFSFFFSFFFFYYYYYHYSYFYYFYFYYFNYYYYHYLRLTRSMSSAQRSAPPLPSVDPAPNSLFESWLQQMKKLFSLGKEITNYY